MELGLLDGKAELFGTVIGQVGFVVKISNTQLNPCRLLWFVLLYLDDGRTKFNIRYHSRYIG